MIFEEIALYNFGIYQGHHTISLDSPNHKKPIILIGALNGAGKTTFLDALQLVLYGKFAKCSNRGRLGYLAYLEKNINSFSEDKSASITLRFRHGDNRKNPQVYEVKRSWSKEEKKECKERISVCFNGEHDQLLSENWEEFVNEFIPQSISELFFFDGEKIENLADPKRSAELLKIGIEALLGLELLSKLSTDLNELKRKKQENLLNIDNAIELDSIKEHLISLNYKKNELKKELKTIEDKEEEQVSLFNFSQNKLLSSGADKLNLKDELDQEKKDIAEKLFAVKHELLKLVSGSLPLILIPNLLKAAEVQSIREKKFNTYIDARELLEQQKNDFLSILSETIEEKECSSIKDRIEQLSEKNQKTHEMDCYLHTNTIYFSGISDRVNEEKYSAINLLMQKKDIEESLILIERKIHTIPTLDSVKELIAESAKREEKLNIVREKKNLITQSIMDIDNEIKIADNKFNAILIKNNSEEFEQKRQSQIISHIDILKDIVISFNTQLVHDNITKLEKKIKSKFDQLKRKDSLITKISIDPVEYTMTLYASNMLEISTERLSAGERQLLAIAILWGLADSSGKELPTIIDTPMGRLDGEHRTRLIEQYFPSAASQVILLSTDEEIYGTYYTKLQPYLAQEYNIIYDENINSSYFKPGYFEVSR
jgi:DNA sulfur modification protein DndD